MDFDTLGEVAVARDFVSLELSHRIRNIFAVVSGLGALSASPSGAHSRAPFRRASAP
ncbi:MAG TPA: hypothetical protein VJY34_22650 [Roseiarcus sp.]|nr:hypothetical protein [Roseiarcus sp.]